MRRGPAGLDAVALTFEYGGGGSAGGDGPEAIVQWLEVNRLPATVFLASGASASDDPVAAVVLARLRAGPALAAGVLLATAAPAAVAADLAAADAALATALGRTAAPLWRPSRGTASPDVLRAAGGAGWTWAIAWDVDPGTGSTRRPAARSPRISWPASSRAPTADRSSGSSSAGRGRSRRCPGSWTGSPTPACGSRRSPRSSG